MDNDIFYAAKYWAWFDRKMKDKPMPMRQLQSRTMNTATTVLTALRNVPFEKLSVSLYFFCEDVKTQYFTRLYESQLELAGANPEKFVKGLHKFYTESAHKIKTENLYQEFFEFVSLCTRARYTTKRTSEYAEEVINCYQSLLLQHTEYLRPDKFNFNVVICGRTTQGEVMTMPDIFPNLDAPNKEMEAYLRKAGTVPKTKEGLDKMVESFFGKYGFKDIKTLEDLQLVTQQDLLYTHHHSALLPYINEYTYDILPDPTRPYTSLLAPFFLIQTPGVDDEQLVSSLKKRARTLPSNGVTFEFNYPEGKELFFQKVLMKEILYGDRIIMLYKFTTSMGDLCGFYDTSDGFLFSVTQECEDRDAYNRIRALLLYLYASAVTRNGAQMLTEINQHIYFAAELDGERACPDYTVTAYGKGGKLKNVYRNEEADKRGPTGPRAGNENYESEVRAIQGFVRRVGEGRTPSREAVERAQALGFDLAPDETYVQPFMKTVLKLKARDQS